MDSGSLAEIADVVEQEYTMMEWLESVQTVESS